MHLQYLRGTYLTLGVTRVTETTVGKIILSIFIAHSYTSELLSCLKIESLDQHVGCAHLSVYHVYQGLITLTNKKVLLRERKRHTARRVVSTPSVVLPGSPRGGGQVPPPGVRYPPRGVRYPPGGSGTPPGGSGTPLPQGGTRSGTPPPYGQTDGWMEGQTCVKTLPSRHTTYAGGKKRT